MLQAHASTARAALSAHSSIGSVPPAMKWTILFDDAVIERMV
jgi:hypothetical protein